jgi:hypothetical protein
MVLTGETEWSVGGMVLTGEAEGMENKTCCIANFSTTNPTWIKLG